MGQSDIVLLGATLVPVGLSAIVAVRPTAYQYGVGIKIFSGGSSGTLEVCPPPVALSGASATGWSLGYPLATSESVQATGPTTFFLAAMGVTMVAAVIFGRTAGASFN